MTIREAIKVLVAIFIWLVSIQESSAVGDEPNIESNIEAYIAPSHTSSSPVLFMRSGLNEVGINSGAVDILFMVDKSGQPNQAMVLRSSGKLFEEPAVAYLLKQKFKPATYAGKVVDSVYRLRVLLDHSQIENISGFVRPIDSPPGFEAYFNKFNKLMDSDESSKDDAVWRIRQMIKLRYRTYFSDMRISMAQHRFARRYGTTENQLKALQKMDMYSGVEWGDEAILNKDSERTIKTSVLKLLFELGLLGEAISYYESNIEKYPELNSMFAEAMQQAKLTRESDQVLERNFRIDSNGLKHFELFKRSIVFDQVQGAIEKIKFRCERRFFEVRFQPDTQLEIPSSWGECSVELIGDAGSRVSMLQQ